MKIIVATSNKHKVEEIQKKFSNYKNIEFLSMDVLGKIPDIIEDGISFEENAVIKAKTVSEYTKDYVLADDSGLIIDALNGEPGIYSARYGDLKTDIERYELILEKMKDISGNRNAKFVCSMALYTPSKEIYVMEAECPGEISHEAKGRNGFGYDPIFYPAGYIKTMAEIDMAEKNRISHRALALEKLYSLIVNKII